MTIPMRKCLNLIQKHFLSFALTQVSRLNHLLLKLRSRLKPLPVQSSSLSQALSREEIILKYVTPWARGIEIAPWCHPLISKKRGYQVEVLDIFDAHTLRQKCLQDPLVSAYVQAIEEVDILSSAVEIDKAVETLGRLGAYDYIISSHNFEHLPDPLRFLQACARVLKSGGILSMAIPDKRGTFDRFGGLTRTADFLQYFLEERTRPSPFQIFDWVAYCLDGVSPFLLSENHHLSFRDPLQSCYQGLLDRLQDPEPYCDTHISLLTAPAFKLILAELNLLDLLPFQVLEITETVGFEFYVHLKNVGIEQAAAFKISDAERVNLHQALLHQPL